MGILGSGNNMCKGFGVKRIWDIGGREERLVWLKFRGGKDD